MANTAPKNPPQKQPSKSSKSTYFFALVFCFIVGAMFLPSMILAFFGMLPSIIGYSFLSKKFVSRFTCFILLNIASVAPFIAELWHRGHTVPNVFRVLSDANAWVMMYMGPCIGLILYFVITSIAHAVLIVILHQRLSSLEKKQKNIVLKWGIEVKSNG